MRSDVRSRTEQLNSDHGAILVMAALGLALLVGIAALALDGGVAFSERRSAQNAADHTAVAAAWAACNSADPIAAADSQVTLNGFTTSDLTLTNISGNRYEAQVDSSVDTRFARVIGVSQVDVSARAVADCTAAAGDSNAIFAGGDNCYADFSKPQLEFNGSDNTIYGGIHSNGNYKISGSDNDFGFGNGFPPDDPFEYATPAPDVSGSGNTYDPPYNPPLLVPAEPWPFSYDPGDPANDLSAFLSDYEQIALNGHPNHFHVTGDIDGDYILANGDGLYYATGNLKLDKDLTASVTLVAEGEVEISGSTQTLSPYQITDFSPFTNDRFGNTLLAFAGKDYSSPSPIEQCDKFTVKMSGSTVDWEGIIFAPGGLVELSGSSNTTFEGSLIGWAVRLNGSDLYIEAGPSGGATVFKVEIVE